ncbi:MAG: outer membrane beta-barrel protein [Bacteroidota bacterium]
MKKFIVFFVFTLIINSGYATNGGGGKDPKPVSRQGFSQTTKSFARPDIPGTLLIDFGFNFLTNSIDTLDLFSAIGSRTINFYYQYDIPLGKSKFSFHPGFGLGLDRYKFERDETVIGSNNSSGDRVVDIVSLGDVLPDNTTKVNKSMLVTNYLDIPIEFRFHTDQDDPKRSFRIAVGGRVGILFDSKTKIKYRADDNNNKLKDKNDFNVSRFRYGVYGRIGVGSFNFFSYYNLSTLFQEGQGPIDANPSGITVGISVTGF